MEEYLFRQGGKSVLRKVAAVVVNKNTRKMLRECLLSLLSQDVEGGIAIWVVDNGSRDGSPEMVLADFPQVNLLWNDENVGYARACNEGIALTEEPFILVMNADTILSQNTASIIVSFFETHPDAAVVGPRLLNTDGTLQFSCREFPSIAQAAGHAFIGLLSEKNPWTRKYKKREWDHLSEREVDWVSGAFMGLRREALEQVGGFDEKYFMYVEDVDLCWMLRQKGWEVWYIPFGDVIHHIGQSSKLATTRMTYHHHRSMFRFYRKTYSGPLKPFMSSLIFLGLVARFCLVSGLNGLNRLKSSFSSERKSGGLEEK